MTNWSLEAAADAFFHKFPSEPRNIYHKDPDTLRSRMPEIAEQILALTTDHSNDYYLDATVEDIIGLLPPAIATDAQGVYVARTPELQPNAEAEALAEDARLAYVYQGLGTALAFYAFLQRRVFHLLQSLDRTTAMSIGDVLFLAEAELPQLVQDPDVALVLEARRRWRSAEEVEINDELIQVFERHDDRSPSGTQAVNELHDLGEHFVVAHEIAHHLLGHLHQKPFAYRSHPAKLALQQARQRTGVAQDGEANWNESQLHEFDADAFAFLTLSGEIAAPDGFDRRRWYGALMGALLALPALEDLAFASAAASGDLEPTRLVADTHPPIGDRVGQIVDFAQRFPPPGDEASDAGHPAGIVAQAVVYWKLLTLTR
jgi:hypothetical protein